VVRRPIRRPLVLRVSRSPRRRRSTRGALYELKGGHAVPFDLHVDASVSGQAMLAAGTKPRFVKEPLKLYPVQSAGGDAVTFSLGRATWEPPTGLTGPTTSVQFALTWPAISAPRLELPLLRDRPRSGSTARSRGSRSRVSCPHCSSPTSRRSPGGSWRAKGFAPLSTLASASWRVFTKRSCAEVGLPLARIHPEVRPARLPRRCRHFEHGARPSSGASAPASSTSSRRVVT
jgi:hypothetical protein